MGFDFERMTMSFETIHTEHQRQPADLPTTRHFLHAMTEVNALFETLGSAFTFVKRDIEKKIAIIKRYATLDPSNFSNLDDAIRYELENQHLSEHNPTHDDMPNCARTLLRLMWALNFADCLLEGLGQTFDPQSALRTYDRTLRWAVGRAYDSTLAPNHSWTIRRTVKGACLLLPSKEAFMVRVGVENHRRAEFIRRLALSMSPLVKRMYAFYQHHDLLQLP